jgi:hypothetical protein
MLTIRMWIGDIWTDPKPISHEDCFCILRGMGKHPEELQALLETGRVVDCGTVRFQMRKAQRKSVCRFQENWEKER